MNVDWWQPFAGLGLFLFAMRQIEQALELASGRRLREFLRRNTDSPVKGVVTGTLVTAISALVLPREQLETLEVLPGSAL